MIVLVILVLIGLFATGGGSGGSGRTGTAPGAHSGGSVSSPAYSLSVASKKIVVPQGELPPVPWPSTGQAAIAIPAAGLMEASGPESPQPIASLTKMMTAYLTLKDHPLPGLSPGPRLQMTEADQQEYDTDQTTDASSVFVKAGEVLTERQLLSGMMVRSANNIADTLAGWDAGGNIDKFVSNMNAQAAALGMTETHYADTNGLHADSESTARDQLAMAEAALRLPSFQAIVDEPTVTLPFVGTLPNYVTAIGSDGVVGVKSGFTQAALSCVVLAAMREVGGRQVLVLAADLGQPLSLAYAQQEDIEMIDAVAGAIKLQNVAAAHDVVGTLSVKGGGSVPVETSEPLVSVVVPGEDVSVYAAGLRLTGAVRAGQQVGFLEASSSDGQPVSVPLVAASALHT